MKLMTDDEYEDELRLLIDYFRERDMDIEDSIVIMSRAIETGMRQLTAEESDDV